jgi:hypothetical protein
MAFFSKSVDLIIKGLNKIHDDLRDHAVEQRTTAQDKLSQASQLTDEAENHHGEARRADHVAENLAKLLGK